MLDLTRRKIYQIFIFVGDAAAVAVAFWAAYTIRFHFPLFLKFFPVVKGVPDWSFYAAALKALVPSWMLVMFFVGRVYQRRFAEVTDELAALLKGVLIASLVMLALTFLYRGYEFSRGVMALGALLAVPLHLLLRWMARIILRLMPAPILSLEKVLLIGHGKSMAAVARQIQRSHHPEILRVEKPNCAALLKILQEKSPVAEVIVSGQLLMDDELSPFFDACEEQNLQVKILPDLLEMRLGEIFVDESLGVPVLHLKSPSLHGFRFFAKRAFDVSLCVIILCAGFWPLALVALLIALESPGGAFFVQERVGFKEKRFRCVKFRTMRQDAEEQLAKMNLESFRGGPAFKMKNDPRITQVGKWLRKLSLDELPQIWNILRGEMSFIGPRPQVLKEAAGNPDWARKRYKVLPGITGLWQVSGRADLTYEDMMRLDIYYLENWSPGLDLKILLKTLPVILSSKGAY